MFSTACLTKSWQKRGQDRADVIRHNQGVVLVVADGAGGTSGGGEAADTVILWVRAYLSRTLDLFGAQWGDFLAKVDQQLRFGNGESTAVVVAFLETGEIRGASVGDSGA